MPRIQVYTDESSTGRQHRYTVIGGIWVPWTREAEIREKIATWRADKRMHAEVKFTKISAGRLARYKEFVDMFFRSGFMHFHSIVVDGRVADHKTYSGGDDELHFYKFQYLLFSRRIEPGRDYYIYVDHRSNRDGGRLGDVKSTVNNWCARQDRLLCRPVRTVEARRSHDDDLIQVADVLSGCVAWRCNGRQGSEAKEELVRHVEQWAGRNLEQGTTRSVFPFNVWRWRPAVHGKERPSPSVAPK